MEKTTSSRPLFDPQPEKTTDSALPNTDKHKKTLESVSTKSVSFDFYVKIGIVFGFIVYVIYQVYSVNH